MGRPVVLWDIDGTLMRTGGVGVRCFTQAIETVTGRTIVRTVRYDFGGKTDPLIAAELLAPLGIDDADVVAAVLAEVERAYLGVLDDLRATVVVCPGVPALLGRCDAGGARQTVVTGNIEPAARHKVEAAGLDHHLLLDCGGYGSDHHDRSELVRLSMARLVEATGPVDHDDVWIVGDTPRDAACARDNDVHCLLVATGTYPIDELATLGADLVVADLSEVDRVATAIGVLG